MKKLNNIEVLTKKELEILKKLDSVAKIQEYLDSTPYSTDPIYRSPRSVMRDRKAHCFDGAVFAALALENMGFAPLIFELKAERDDDHILAIFKKDNHWGAIGKSNFTTLRFREPVFKNLRELALSYFEFFYNMNSEKTLRAYSVSISLKTFSDWKISDGTMEEIALCLEKSRHYQLITKKMVKNLFPIDQLTYDAGMLGTNKEGLFDPNKKK